MRQKRRAREFIILISLISLAICIYIASNVISTLKYRGGRPDEIIYASNIDNDIKYKAYLKHNNFIDQPYVTSEFSFVSSLIQYLQTSFLYHFAGDSSVSLNYDYYIKATITSKYVSENATSYTKPLWNKEFIILDHKKGTAPNSLINIDETLNIGLDYYNNMLELFRQSLNISLDSKLDITFAISISGQLKNNKTLNKEHNMTMSIPLGVPAFDINIYKNFAEHEVTYSREQKGATVSYMFAIVYIVLIIIIISITIYFIKAVLNKGKNIFESRVHKILKDYDDRIVTVSNFIRYEKLDVIDIPTFDELLTLSDETLEPIIYWEKKNRNSKEAWFSIIRDKVIYRYIISYTSNK